MANVTAAVETFQVVSDNLLSPLFFALGSAAAVGLSSIGAGVAIKKLGNDILDLGASESSTSETLPLVSPSSFAATSINTGRSPSTMRNFIPVIMASTLAIYGLILAVIIAQNSNLKIDGHSNLPKAVANLAAGLAVGLACLGGGYAMSGLAPRKEPSTFVRMIMLNIYGESLGLYGLIIGLILASSF